MDERIKELEDLITQYAQSYYEGQQEIPDADFDILVEKLRALNPESDILNKVGWGYAVDERIKVEHIPAIGIVGSLDKIKYPDKCQLNNVIVMPKFDGGTIVLYYLDGKLIDAITRGDGIRGMSVINKMRYLTKSIKIDMPGLVSIRGEVIIPKSYHEELIARGIPHPRNYANGIMNRIEAGPDIDMLRFVPYSIRTFDRQLLKTDMLKLLNSWGFKRIPSVYLKYTNPDDLKNLYDEWAKEFPIDGVVICCQDTTTTDFASDDKTYKYIIENAIAYKFDSERAQVEVGKLDWQVGETGRLTPMIRIKDPVSLSGATISNVMAHNATQVIERGIGVGAKITIERANEIIPYLVSVDEPVDIVLPDTCPECGNKVVWKNMDLICPFLGCPSRKFAIIKSILSISGIPDGMGDSMLARCLESNNIDTIERIFTIPELIEESGHYGKLVKTMHDALVARMTAGYTFEQFWKMIRIPGLGEAHAKTLMNTDPESFESIEEVQAMRDLVPSNVFESLLETYDYWYSLSKIVPLIKEIKEIKEEHMRVAVTGAVSMVRKEFEKLLADKGIKLGDITKDTDYLICNEMSNSSKCTKAQKLGIQIISEKDFMTLIDKK